MKNAHQYKYIVGALSGLALTASAASAVPGVFRSPAAVSPAPTQSRMTVSHSFQTQFAVPLSCDGCVKDVSKAVLQLPGISKVEGNVDDQSITIEGTAPPSAIVKAIQATGRDAILRGSGSSNGAAVSILETYYHLGDKDAAEGDAAGGNKDRFVRGLARMVQVSPSVTVIDLTMLGVAPGVYHASIREFGDLKDGVLSAGPVWRGQDSSSASAGEAGTTAPLRRGVLGTVEVGPDGRGAVFLDRPFQVWEVIGHAFAVTPVDESKEDSGALQNSENTVVGVIARSAGVWDNDKTVCSCSGKTLWDERRDEVKKGMV